MAHHCGEQAEVGLHSACRRGLRARSESPNDHRYRHCADVAGQPLVTVGRCRTGCDEVPRALLGEAGQATSCRRFIGRGRVVIGHLHPLAPSLAPRVAYGPQTTTRGRGLWAASLVRKRVRKAAQQVNHRRAPHGCCGTGQLEADAPISPLSTRRRRSRRGRYGAPPSSRRPWRIDRRPPPGSRPAPWAAARPLRTAA